MQEHENDILRAADALRGRADDGIRDVPSVRESLEDVALCIKKMSTRTQIGPLITHGQDECVTEPLLRDGLFRRGHEE